MRLREADYVISAKLIGVKDTTDFVCTHTANILPALLSAIAISLIMQS